MHINHVRAHRDKITDLTRENGELVLRNQQNVKHITEVRPSFSARHDDTMLISVYDSSTRYWPIESRKLNPKSPLDNDWRSRLRVLVVNYETQRRAVVQGRVAVRSNRALVVEEVGNCKN